MVRFLPAILLCGIAASQAPADGNAPLGVGIVTAEPQTLTRQYSITGEIRASDRVSAAFPVAGRIDRILVEEGQHVDADAVMARMDSVQQIQAVYAAQAALASARADRRQAATTFARSETLWAQGDITRAAHDADQDSLTAAMGALAQATAELNQAEKHLADTLLKAPQHATVIRRLAEDGQVVSAAQPVLELALSDKMEAAFQVPAVLLTGTSIPETVEISPLTGSDNPIVGRISEVAPFVDPETGTTTVIVDIDGAQSDLTYGEAVRGTVTITEPDRIVLPYTVLSSTAAGPAVWRVAPESGHVTLSPIEIDRYETGQIVLAGGVAPGDRIVARGAQLLYPGRQVQAIEAAQ